MEDGSLYWVELRPKEGGRQTLVHMSPDGRLATLLPAPFNVRSRVHEYGGRPYAVYEGAVYFSNYQDQRIWVLNGQGDPRPLTPESPLRYADYLVDASRRRLLCIREDHSQSDQDAANTLVSINMDDGSDQLVLASGNDFYASPALSPDGRRLAWLTWNHPNMPWDGTELWVGELDEAGMVHDSRLVAGGLEESIFQPEWSPDGELFFVSDRSNWWNIYRLSQGKAEPVYPMEAEFGVPLWQLGSTRYGFLSPGRIACTYNQNGASHLGIIQVDRKEMQPIPSPYTSIGGLLITGEGFIVIGGSPTRPSSIAAWSLEKGEFEVLQRSGQLDIDLGYLSRPEVIEFPTENGLTAYGFFYPPKNRDYRAPAGEKPPLIVFSHGGPTGSTGTGLNLGIQFWTSRGFAVLDVNYGGSTGYGREYRNRLYDSWGIVDVNDCVNGAKYLAEQGFVDGDRLAIRGGSAGGFTTLAALSFRDTFNVGACYFGVADLGALARDTHKFESRYMDKLVGPYPEREDIYYERSPINSVDKLNCPIIFFQGLEDKVVPPEQSETMFNALKEKGLPTAYLPFEGEQHGFRKAETNKRAIEAEYYFYARNFGFSPADEIEPVEIVNG
jgi:dipeptidyl aminopeptidase/acylaminoacyl peptidase